MTREALIRDLMVVRHVESTDGGYVDPTCLGYEGRFIALCCAWPDVALPAAVARDITSRDLTYGASVGLYDWILTRWRRDKPTWFSAFISEREWMLEEVDSWWHYHDDWMHFGACWFPDQWHPDAASGYWPEVSEILAARLIDKILEATFRRQFTFALRGMEARLERTRDPRQAVAELISECRRVARRARPRVRAGKPMPQKKRYHDAGVL